MRHEVPPPPQDVIDRLLARHGNALRAAFADVEADQQQDETDSPVPDQNP